MEVIHASLRRPEIRLERLELPLSSKGKHNIDQDKVCMHVYVNHVYRHCMYMYMYVQA